MTVREPIPPECSFNIDNEYKIKTEMIKENTGYYFDDLTEEKASLSMSKSDSHKGIKDFTTNI